MENKSAVNLSLGVLFALGSAIAAELILQPPVGAANYVAFASRVAVIFLVLFALHRFGSACLRDYKPQPKDMGCLIGVLLGSLLILSLGRLVALSLSSYLASAQGIRIAPLSLYLAIPYATGALLLQSVLGMQYGLIFAVSFAIITGMYLPDPQFLIPYVLSTVLTGCLSLSRFRARSAYLKAGVHVALIASLFALASIAADGDLPALDVLLRLLSAVLSGILSTFIAAGVIPLVESLGGYVTDMRLIEMATLDHPLLKELSIQAPGTWNHSMVMGMMVEAAADAIGANPVLARVGAYFHDIGKMKKPLYFVENQLVGENRHDKLSPSMSALIIRAHVKDGIEMAKQHRLPRAIEDMIPQHHGTSLIEYFYDKAIKEQESAASDGAAAAVVERGLYAYPGPRPQTREAGLLMLADGVEAAARTLSEPTLDRIQGMVQKMINKVFASGELDECELTLQDLHQIAKCFTRVLNGIYHQRIAYAEPAEKVHEKAPKSEEGREPAVDGSRRDSDALKRPKGPEERPGKDGAKENLKRLGL